LGPDVKLKEQIIFSSFRLDTVNRSLRCGERVISLRPKTFAVLRYLLQHPGRLVTKDELLDAVWPKTSVSDTVLKVCIRELREALGDDPQSPRFIETAHRSGYRFIADIRTNNLPLPLTSFIGREREIVEIKSLLERARLLTLTGAGGSGKTRLAIQAAGELVCETEEEVWWVDLAALSDPGLLPQAVAAAMGVREQSGRALSETLVSYLGTKKLLLLLDNCEHLIAACAELAGKLLRACRRLKVLATSREALGVSGEIVWPVPGLSLTGPGDPPVVEELPGCEAIQLFVERATAALPRFALTEQNAATVAQICRRLDGLPLAIELAAARVKALAVEQIAARLDNCFRLLASGSRAELPRHQTLRATIDWSYDLLAPADRVLMHRLSVFAGGLTLEAVEVVCAGDGIAQDNVLDLLSRLVDKSLISVAEHEQDGVARYRLLETVRQYGQERLLDSAEAAAVRRRHVRYFLRLAEEIEPRINTAERQKWLGRLADERGNLRAALRYAIELKEPEIALRLAGAIFWFWFHRGDWTEGRKWIAEAIAECRTLNAESGVAPDGEEAAFNPQSTARNGRNAHLAKALFGEGVLAWAQGDHAAANSQLEESVAIWRKIQDRLGLAHALHFFSVELLGHGANARARALAEESVAIFRQSEDRFGLAVSLASLGVVAQAQADYPSAQSFLAESVAVFRASGDNWGLALPLRNLGVVAFRLGDYERAVTFLQESLIVQRELGERWFISRSLETLAEILALRGDHEMAARLFGAGEALREAVGASVLPFYRDDYERGMAAVRAGLSGEALAAAWAAGRAMTMTEAIAIALTVR
jgi:predicted ATPase/DNA-binding winged helix-turn-helix (wHTH) protein